MITKDYVSFEVAKLLKEKGFIQKCPYYYLDGQMFTHCYQEVIPKNKEIIERPTQAIAMKWLREVHNIFIYIEPFITTSGLQGYKPYCTKIGWEFMWINPLRKYSNTSSDTYEEACEAAIKYCLENLI